MPAPGEPMISPWHKSKGSKNPKKARKTHFLIEGELKLASRCGQNFDYLNRFTNDEFTKQEDLTSCKECKLMKPELVTQDRQAERAR